MTGGVVHAFQVVEVGERHEQRFIAAARQAEIPGRQRQEPTPVVQARQIVDESEVQERGMEAVPLDRQAEGGVSAVGAAARDLVAPLLVERNDLQTALAHSTLVVNTAGRQKPPVDSSVLACDHARALCGRAWKMGAEPLTAQSTLLLLDISRHSAVPVVCA